MAAKNRSMPEWGGGRSGFKLPKTPTRIARRNNNAAAVARVKGAKVAVKKKK